MARKARQARVRAHCTVASTLSSSSSSLLATAVTAAALLGGAAAATTATGLNQAASDRSLFVVPSPLPRAPAWGARTPRNCGGVESASAVWVQQRSRWCERGLVGERHQRPKRCFSALSMAASSDEDVSKAAGGRGEEGKGGVHCV